MAGSTRPAHRLFGGGLTVITTMFDSHCHLDLTPFQADRDAVVQRASERGIRGMLIAGIEPDGWPEQSRLARKYSQIMVSYGVHPHVVAEADNDDIDLMLGALAAALDAADEGILTPPVALGETGLDRSNRVDRGSLPRQERAFSAQLSLARHRDLPVVLHILAAHGRALELLEAEGLPAAGGVVHSYSGSAEMVERYCRLGLYISMAGSVTFPTAKKAHRAAAIIPRDRLLVETDAPDQCPSPYRPKRNEPAYLDAIINAVAELRGEDPAEVAAYTETNARRLYQRGAVDPATPHSFP